MPTVWIPPLLRRLTNDQESIQITGATLAEIIDALDARFPGIKAKLCDGEQVRPGLAVVVDGQIVRGGLSEVLNENSEVHFIPAVAGGGL